MTEKNKGAMDDLLKEAEIRRIEAERLKIEAERIKIDLERSDLKQKLGLPGIEGRPFFMLWLPG